MNILSGAIERNRLRSASLDKSGLVSPQSSADTPVHGETQGGLGMLPSWDFSGWFDLPEDKKLLDIKTSLEQLAKQFRLINYQKLQSFCDSKDVSSWLRALSDYSLCVDMIVQLSTYADLYQARQSNSQTNKNYGDIYFFLTSINQQILFFELEFNSLEASSLVWLQTSSQLQFYRPYFKNCFRFKPHQLEERLEQYINEANLGGIKAVERIYEDKLTHMKFDIDDTSSGTSKPIALEQALEGFFSPDRSKRRHHGEVIGRTLKQDDYFFSHVINAVAYNSNLCRSWRNYKNIGDERHLANDLDAGVVNNLVSAVDGSYARLSHRYYGLKAKLLGFDNLMYYDRNAPYRAIEEPVVAWSKAKDIVLESFAGFDSRLSDIAELFFTNGWIDAAKREYKAPGAFAHPSAPSDHPWVLINYQGSRRDVMTLAHELGHGVHQFLSRKQGPLMAYTSLTLAETASVFGEMLVFDYLLKQAGDPQTRLFMILGKIEDMLNTVVRQIGFYQFELACHHERARGELSVSKIEELWITTQAKALGSSVILGDDYVSYWSYVSHFIRSPFYVYSYAFGDCLVNALFQLYKSGGMQFKDSYFKVLELGGTIDCDQLGGMFNINLTKPDFWCLGLDHIESWIDKAEELSVHY